MHTKGRVRRLARMQHNRTLAITLFNSVLPLVNMSPAGAAPLRRPLRSVSAMTEDARAMFSDAHCSFTATAAAARLMPPYQPAPLESRVALTSRARARWAAAIAWSRTWSTFCCASSKWTRRILRAERVGEQSE